MVESEEGRLAILTSPYPTDLSALLDSIQATPDDPAHWHAYAGWLVDNGRVEETAVVRVFWPAIAETVALGVPVAEALEQVRRNASRLGKAAREIEEDTCRG